MISNKRPRALEKLDGSQMWDGETVLPRLRTFLGKGYEPKRVELWVKSNGSSMESLAGCKETRDSAPSAPNSTPMVQSTD